MTQESRDFADDLSDVEEDQIDRVLKQIKNRKALGHAKMLQSECCLTVGFRMNLNTSKVMFNEHILQKCSKLKWQWSSHSRRRADERWRRRGR
ncbi:unnamed protein product, partial [Iphiclides podalirius]